VTDDRLSVLEHATGELAPDRVQWTLAVRSPLRVAATRRARRS
jgi:hypothetical protein